MVIACVHILCCACCESKCVSGSIEKLLSCMAECTCASFYQGSEGSFFHLPSSFPNNTYTRKPIFVFKEEASMIRSEEAPPWVKGGSSKS